MRDEQMKMFERSAVEQLISDSAADIRRRLPGSCLPLSGAQLRALCGQGIAEARAYGITERDDIVSFLDVVVAHGADFLKLDSFGWAEPLLTDASIGGDVKVAILLDRMPEHLRPDNVSSAAMKNREGP